jgi:hypothetical protein
MSSNSAGESEPAERSLTREPPVATGSTDAGTRPFGQWVEETPDSLRVGDD